MVLDQCKKSTARPRSIGDLTRVSWACPKWTSIPKTCLGKSGSLWRTIKTYLPPAMIDTEENERSVAWRIGFLVGYGAEKAAAAAIREYGLVGGAWLVALFAWAYEYQKRNS